MSRWRNNGGWNKSHGTVEKTPRIDSFDDAISEGGGSLFVCMDGKTELLDCDHYTEYGPETEREIVELWAGKWSQTLELSRKENGYGGSQAFFLCPVCGERRRYLYLVGRVFKCRKCSRLNYRSQQETRSDSMYYYDKGMAQGVPGWVQLLRMDSRTAPIYAPEHISEISAAVRQISAPPPNQGNGGYSAAAAAVQMTERPGV